MLKKRKVVHGFYNIVADSLKNRFRIYLRPTFPTESQYIKRSSHLSRPNFGIVITNLQVGHSNTSGVSYCDTRVSGSPLLNWFVGDAEIFCSVGIAFYVVNVDQVAKSGSTHSLESFFAIFAIEARRESNNSV